MKLPRKCNNYMVCRDINMKNVSEATPKMQQLHGIQGRKQNRKNVSGASQKMQQLHGTQGRKQEKCK